MGMGEMEVVCQEAVAVTPVVPTGGPHGGRAGSPGDPGPRAGVALRSHQWQVAVVPHRHHHPRQWVLALPATWRPHQPSESHSLCKDTTGGLSFTSHLHRISFACRRAERPVSCPPPSCAPLGACHPLPFLPLPRLCSLSFLPANIFFPLRSLAMGHLHSAGGDSWTQGEARPPRQSLWLLPRKPSPRQSW